MIANNIKLLVIMLAIFAIPFNVFLNLWKKELMFLLKKLSNLKEVGFWR